MGVGRWFSLWPVQRRSYEEGRRVARNLQLGGAGEAACFGVTLEWATKDGQRGGSYTDFSNIVCVVATGEEH